MSHTKQNITLVCIILSVLVVIGSSFLGPIPFIATLASVALSWFVYRIVMRYTRSCPHCRVWWNLKTWLSTKRQHYVEPMGSVLSKTLLCTTMRTCGYRFCSHFGKEEEAKPSYTKEPGKVHRRVLEFAGLL